MSTQILAFLLLTKFKNGVEMHVLVKESENLVNILSKRGRDVGFSGNFDDVVIRAVILLTVRKFLNLLNYDQRFYCLAGSYFGIRSCIHFSRETDSYSAHVIVSKRFFLGLLRK